MTKAYALISVAFTAVGGTFMGQHHYFIGGVLIGLGTSLVMKKATPRSNSQR